MPPHASPNPLLSYGLPLLIFAIVFGLRARRLTQTRPLKVEWLWVVPAIYLVVAIVMFIQFRPTPSGWALSVVGLAVGAALGWQRGRTVTIAVDPETHALSQKASLLGMLFLLVIIGARSLARIEGAALHLDMGLITDVAIALGLGLFSAQRLEMYLRARQLLTAARA